jgi:hypothetical protein
MEKEKKPFGGRPKGCKNKTTKSVKEALVAAYAAIGGDETLAGWAKQNKTDFYKIWSKMLPTDVTFKDVSKMTTKQLKEEAASLLSELDDTN